MHCYLRGTHDVLVPMNHYYLHVPLLEMDLHNGMELLLIVLALIMRFSYHIMTFLIEPVEGVMVAR